MKFRHFVPALIFLVVAWGLALVNDTANKPNFMVNMVGKAAPQFETESLDGKAKISDQEVRGKIVNFWATWCVSCRAEHEFLLQLKKDGYEVIGVNSGDKKEKALEYLKEMGNPFAKVAYDPTRKLAVAFGTTGMPETFVVGKDGVITYHYRGALNAPLLEEVKKAYEQVK